MKQLDWRFGNRHGIQTVEIFGSGMCHGSIPIGAYNEARNRQIHQMVSEYFANNPNSVIFTIYSDCDAGNFFFDDQERFIEALLVHRNYSILHRYKGETLTFQNYLEFESNVKSLSLHNCFIKIP